MDSQSTPEPAEISVGYKDIDEGRAFLRLPFVSKLLLSHWAGAPWSDKSADAHLHALQVEVLAHREREQIVHGASRLGKSVLGGCKLVCASVLPKRKIAVVAGSYMHVSHEFQYLYKGMKALWASNPQLIKRLAFKSQNNYHEYDCDLAYGTRAIGISTENEEGSGLLGRELTDIVLGEGSHVSAHIFNTKLLRAADGALMGLGGFEGADTGCISIFTTPKEEQGCSAAEWDRVMKQTRRQPEKLHYGQVPWAQTVWIREASVLENPEYDRKVFNVRKATLNARAFEEQWLGKMGNSSGRVYSALQDVRHILPLPDAATIRGMRLAVGWDTGAYTAASLVGITKARRRWILGEVQTERETLSWSVGKMKDMLLTVLGPVFGSDDVDALIARIDVWAIDPASQHKLDLMELVDGIGLESPSARDQRTLLESTNTLNTWFENDELFIAEDCELTVEQYRKWLWKTVKTGKGLDSMLVKEPAKGNDHLCDASRFALLCLDNHGPLVDTPTPVTFKDAWERAQREAVTGPLKKMLADAREREERDGVRFEAEDRRPGDRARLFEVVR